MMKSADADSQNVTSTPTAYIKSHSTFKFGQHGSRYPNNVTLNILLSGFPDSTIQLTVEFIYINIGDESSCSNNTNGDIFNIVISSEDNRFTCSDVSDSTKVKTQVIDLQNTFFISFVFKTSNRDKKGGLLLKYSGINLKIL